MSKPMYKEVRDRYDTCITRANEMAKENRRDDYFRYLGKTDVFAGILEEMGYGCSVTKKIYKNHELPYIISRNVGGEVLVFRKENDQLQEALEYIQEFMEMEYGTVAPKELKDIKRIELAYTTLEDYEDVSVQIVANLDECLLITEIGGIKVRTEKYKDLEEMTDIVFKRLNFNDLIRTSYEEEAFALKKITEEEQ